MSESCGVEDVDIRLGCSRFNITGTRSKRILVRCNSRDTGADTTIALPGLAINQSHEELSAWHPTGRWCRWRVAEESNRAFSEIRGEFLWKSHRKTARLGLSIAGMKISHPVGPDVRPVLILFRWLCVSYHHWYLWVQNYSTSGWCWNTPLVLVPDDLNHRSIIFPSQPAVRGQVLGVKMLRGYRCSKMPLLDAESTLSEEKLSQGALLWVINYRWLTHLFLEQFIYWIFPISFVFEQSDKTNAPCAMWLIHGRSIVLIFPIRTIAFPRKYHVQLRQTHPLDNFKYDIWFCAAHTTHRKQRLYFHVWRGLSNAVQQTLNSCRSILIEQD